MADPLASVLPLRADSASPLIVVFERGQRWRAALHTCVERSRLRVSNLRWVAAARHDDVSAVLDGTPTGCAVIEVSLSSVPGDLATWETWKGDFPRACLVAVLDRMYEPVSRRELTLGLLEVGAAQVVDSPRQSGELLALFARHWRHTRSRHYPDYRNGPGPTVTPWRIPEISLPASWT